MNEYSGSNFGEDFATNMPYGAVSTYLEASSLLSLDEEESIMELSHPSHLATFHPVGENSLRL